MSRLIILLIAVLSGSALWGQPAPKMRTRLFTSLTNTEIEQYLKRNDVIFVPVGTVEPHGGMPVDCEYVGPLAWAMKLAEKADGLVFPGLVYFFPDATIVGRAGVHVLPYDGTAYLKVIAKSLLRQGFRRQVYVTGHAPSFDYMSPFVREFYDETHVPILFAESSAFMRPGNTPGMPNFDDFNKMTIGAYQIAGRLGDVPADVSQPPVVHPSNPGTENLFPLGPQSGTVGFYFADPTEHGGSVTAIKEDQRAADAKAGVALYDEQIKSIDINGILQSLRDHDKYTQQNLVPKYGWMFPTR